MTGRRPVNQILPVNQMINEKRKNELVFLATKKGKKARKQLSTLLIKDLKESLGNPKSDDPDKEDDSHLFQLIRGVPTVMISRGEKDGIDFKPLKPKSFSEVGAIEGDEGGSYSHVPTAEESSDQYQGHPIFDLCSPKEYYLWTKD
jgi:hypothetical protein